MQMQGDVELVPSAIMVLIDNVMGPTLWVNHSLCNHWLLECSLFMVGQDH
jgi:hypothetical protein